MLQWRGSAVTELKKKCHRPFARRTPTSFAALVGYARIGLCSSDHGIVAEVAAAATGAAAVAGVAPQPVPPMTGSGLPALVVGRTVLDGAATGVEP